MNAATKASSMLPKTSLYLSEGSSDKEYHAEVLAKDDGFIVNFRYGRRGAALTCGCKTPAPVELAQAIKVFDKLVKEKTSKGYTPDESGSAYQDSDKAGRKTDFIPQLCNVITEDKALRLIEDDRYVAQEKMDGDRRAARAVGYVATGMNRKGLSVPLPMSIASEMTTLAAAGEGEILIDCEIIGEKLYVFDLLVERGNNLRKLGWLERMTLAEKAVANCQNIKPIPVAITTDEKRALWEKVKAEKGEGVVFKVRNCVSTEARPNSGGDWLKYPFTARHSFCVLGHREGKRSINIGVLKDGIMVSVGHVTIPANHELPNINDVVDVQYLYAYENGGLHITVYCGKRTDVDIDECQAHLLKYKKVAEEISIYDDADLVEVEEVFTYDDADLDALMKLDGVSVEDWLIHKGIAAEYQGSGNSICNACEYMGNGIWLLNGDQYDSNDLRAFLKRQHGYRHD